jgi:hypothetical protein
LAQDFYIVKSGDVLSRIVQNKYPSERIYGTNGKLAEVKKLNPRILNLNIIFPNQKIQFHPSIVIENSASIAKTENIIIPDTSSVPENFATDVVERKPEIILDKKSEPAQQPKEKDRRVSENLGLEEWNISALYGAKYLSVSQTGALGKAEVGVLFLNDLKLNSEFLFDDWSFGFQFDSYKFKYETLTSGDSKQMYALNLFGSYKWFLGGLNIEQSPLFRNNSGNIEMTKMTLMYLSLGAKKDIELPTRKPTVLKLKGWMNFPFSSSSDNADIKLDSIKGFGVNGQVELNRQIFAKEDYSLHATWMTQVGFQKLTQNVEWDVSRGEAKSDILDASTTLGLLFKF